MILAIDTSTEEAGVALLDGETLQAEWNWITRNDHSRHLTAALRHVLSFAGADLSAVTGIAVAVGPGSFNGLRVGVSEAKGLAMALGVPATGVSTLDVIGYGAALWSGPIWALLTAGRGEVFRATYHGGRDSWRRTGPYERVPVAQAAAEYRSGTLLAGPGAPPVWTQLGVEGQAAVRLPHAVRMRRAGYLAELGRRNLAAGDHGDSHAIQPMYLRRSSAEEKREARSND